MRAQVLPMLVMFETLLLMIMEQRSLTTTPTQTGIEIKFHLEQHY